MEAIYVLLVIFFLNEIDAIGDALRGNIVIMHRTIAWWSEDIMLLISMGIYPIVIAATGATVLQAVAYFGGFILMRGAIFNISYNFWKNRVTKELKRPWWWFGAIKWWDQFLGWCVYTGPIAKWIKPREGMFIGILSIFMLLFSLLCIAIWELFPQ